LLLEFVVRHEIDIIDIVEASEDAIGDEEIFEPIVVEIEPEGDQDQSVAATPEYSATSLNMPLRRLY